MPISWELFQDYIRDLVEDVPIWVCVLALSIFVGGSALVLTVKGRKKEGHCQPCCFCLFIICSCFARQSSSEKQEPHCIMDSIPFGITKPLVMENGCCCLRR